MIDKQYDIDYSKILMFHTKAMITNDIKIFGNPVKDKLTFSYYSNSAQEAYIKVYDLAGKPLMNQLVKAAEGSNLLSLSLNSSFKTGTYAVEVSFADSRQVAKFIKQ
jgi:hypothetical protein